MPVSLIVQEGYTSDLAHGLVRVDYDIIDALGISNPEGDAKKMAVEIRNQKGNSTFAKVVPLKPSDEGEGLVRMDRLIRDNAGVDLGDRIELNKSTAYKAERVRLEPLEAIPPTLHKGYFAESLNSILVKVGDKVVVRFFGGILSFKVVKLFPQEQQGAALIVSSTVFEFTELSK